MGCQCSELIDSGSGANVAHYEYGPFGEVTASTGDLAVGNPFRFSTKYWDDETGLGYWGYRYYDPITGRWLSRDPIGEKGGVNLHGYCANNSIDLFDILGLSPSTNSCANGFCVVGSTIEDWYGSMLQVIGIDHVDIAYNGHVIYVGKGGGLGRMGREFQKNSRTVLLSKTGSGMMKSGKKTGCKCKDMLDSDIQDCLQNRKASAGKNCQGDVQDAQSDCCLSGYRTLVGTFFPSE